MIDDTIAAVSTPRGKGGVALLRISGKDAVAVAEKVFRPASGVALGEAPARTALYGTIYAPGRNGEPEGIDNGIATVFRAPASFTGENTVEIGCHGGILLTETVLGALLGAGARAAEAGEFTRRAFLHGKMSLDGAEALGDLLEAVSREQITLAHAGMQGHLGKAIRAAYEKLRDVMAATLACIDFPEEDLAGLSREEMQTALTDVRQTLAALAATWRTGHAVAEGVRTVICGHTNVGKSTLYNCLVGRDAAIVTDVAGTTRDVLTETAVLGSVTLRLCDTAGLRETGDPVERIGVERAEAEMEEAELLLAVFDLTRPLLPAEEALLCRLADRRKAPVIAVLNKADEAAEAGEKTRRQVKARIPDCVELSAKTGVGREKLARLVEERFTDGTLDLRQDAVVANARQAAALARGIEALEQALAAFAADLPVDLVCDDVSRAMQALCEIDGREVDEDVVGTIFSHFCVGK